MKNPDSAFFQHDVCLTEERMLNYLQGKLSPGEQHEVEKHLLDCELCSDALEGLQLMKDPTHLKSINAEIKDNIETRLLEEELPVAKVMFPWRIAAAFALIFVSAATLWIVLPKTNSEKLFTQEYKPYPSPAEIAEPLDSNNSAETLNNANTYGKEALPPAQTADVKKVESQEPSKAEENLMTQEVKATGLAVEEKTVAAESAPANVDEEVAVTDSKVPTKKEKEETTNYKITSPSTFNESTEKKTTKEVQSQPAAAMSKRNADAVNLQSTTTTPVDFYNEAMQLYTQEKFAEAAQLFDKVPSKPEALFYSGVSYLSSDQPHIAIKRLKEYRNTKSTTYTEASWWYEGLANLKMDKKKDASAAFKEVVKLNGEHAEKAQELLMKL